MHAPSQQQKLPDRPPVDVDAIKHQLGLDDFEIRELMRALERRGRIFSRIDQSTMRKLYFKAMLD